MRFKTTALVALLALVAAVLVCVDNAAAANRQTLLRGAHSTRAQLAQLVWPDGAPPNVTAVQAGATLTVPLPEGFASVAHLIRPKRPNGKAFIWHNGHQNEADGNHVARALADAGFLVVVMNMPMFGPSVTPPDVLVSLYHWPSDGALKATACGGWAPYGAHELFACYDHALQYFITPVRSVVSWLNNHGYQDVSMAGLSGGGWTTVVASALDPRIRHSFSVAGTLPQHLVTECDPTHLFPAPPLAPAQGCNLDWEGREILKVADYDALYELAALEPGRTHTGIWNQHEPGPFPGDHRNQITPAIQATLHRVGGGTFTGLLDTKNTTHSVSPQAVKWMLGGPAAPLSTTP